MKKFILAAYIFFFTGGCFAQKSKCKHDTPACTCWKPIDRQNIVVAEIDFNHPGGKSDTVRATLLITRESIRNAFSYEGYAVFRDVPGRWVLSGDTLAPVRDTTYLDDRKRPIKPPITVWGMKEKEQTP
jgi:hypothetical protein